MKTIILAGGLGTRLSEETSLRPKPMVEIGGVPILVHIMSIYGAYGCRDFLVACGYKGEYIKEYFSQFQIRHSDWSVNLKDGSRTILRKQLPDWNVSPVDTGNRTMTGGRILRLGEIVEDETFMVTYGDGVADVNIEKLLEFHHSHGRLATVTAVHPPARFGCLRIEDGEVSKFAEKPQTAEGWINGGFFVFEPGVLRYLDGDDCVLEKGALERLSQDGELMAYQHDGFWQPMDTLREKHLLEDLWNSSNAPWKVWNDEQSFEGLSRQKGFGQRDHGVQGAVALQVA
ncbi:glucose-1-phosphate cytidylyltransferase [Calycomorphotria hydatis]|uniref:Glucose-1-phosphate cytidylyltransferase n=1 Tax=Calycomorphotria hydatis TaxID=2528027 RepID=A0A517T7C1_9PLAN|nr:glucose-1-phosphate cytidylyltransferase [Calycomorphotria hydatis]QDT64271.1 Glucose-1-phosphate cytidylyltransferase [Calycomorphotria hydatis]